MKFGYANYIRSRSCYPLKHSLFGKLVFVQAPMSKNNATFCFEGFLNSEKLILAYKCSALLVPFELSNKIICAVILFSIFLLAKYEMLLLTEFKNILKYDN